MRQLSWAVQLLVSALLLVTPASLHAEDAQATAPLCKPQVLDTVQHTLTMTKPITSPAVRVRANTCSGTRCLRVQSLLKLTAPFSPPRATGGLAWCSEYGACSCCEHQHVALAYNSLRAVLADPDFSPKCTAFLTKLACR